MREIASPRRPARRSTRTYTRRRDALRAPASGSCKLRVGASGRGGGRALHHRQPRRPRLSHVATSTRSAPSERRARERGGDPRPRRGAGKFDPSGVAARDLRECLTIQAADARDRRSAQCCGSSTCSSTRLIKRDFRGVSRARSASRSRRFAAGVHGDRPGSSRGPAARSAAKDPVYIVPDIYVYRIGRRPPTSC